MQNDQEKAIEFIKARAEHFREKYEKEFLFTDKDRAIERETFIGWLLQQK